MNRSFYLLALGLALASPGSSAVINVSPADSYTKIEAARAGDEVVVAPGTYRFRVFLTGQGTPSAPITIRAQDPANRPVWDFSASLVENAAGSYTAPDRGRGGWQVFGGGNYHLSGLVFTGCRTASQNSAGLRYYGGTTGLYLKDCLFQDNDNGITGGTGESELAVEYCEFNHNGNTAATSATHNLYIYGGTFLLRYSSIHDSVQAENFHIRARLAVLEYNWFSNPANYEGDLMTDDDFSGAGPFSQSMLVRGNVFVENPNPGNHSQVLVAFNDTALANESMALTVLDNTFIGNGEAGNGGAAAFVHLSNGDGTKMSATISNNIIYGTTKPTQIESAGSGSIQGSSNWLATAAAAGPLTGSIVSASPGFRNAGGMDYTLAPGSVAIGAATTLGTALAPSREIFGGSASPLHMRQRFSSKDLGAFESTSSGNGLGAYDPEPLPIVSISASGSGVLLSWPLTAPDFALQETPSLPANGTWSDSASSFPVTLNGYQFVAPPGSGSRFYRLQQH